MSGSAAATKNMMSFEEAWPILQEEAINKIINNDQQFTSDQYMRIYTVVYNVCNPNPISPEVQKLYDQYKKTFEDHISSEALPSLRGRINEDLLQELLQRWKLHKTMTKWLSRFFHYVDRYFTPLKKLPSLVETSHSAFYNLVYGEMNDQIRNAIISLIVREREGEQIDQALVKEALDIYIEIAEGSTKYYNKDLEEAMVDATKMFYSRKALEWIANESYEDYMIKVEECLKQEKIRVANYLEYESKSRILKVAEHELLIVHASKLEEMKHDHEASA